MALIYWYLQILLIKRPCLIVTASDFIISNHEILIKTSAFGKNLRKLSVLSFEIVVNQSEKQFDKILD